MTWLSMVAVGLACCQLSTAAWIFRKLPWSAPGRIREIHRWTGRLAILFVLPVVYWCIFQLGFQTFDSRVLAHSVLGTLFVGAVEGKITVVRLRRFPAWTYLLAGVLVLATLAGAGAPAPSGSCVRRGTRSSSGTDHRRSLRTPQEVRELFGYTRDQTDFPRDS
jgi:Family of unknown function (DUF6529)